MIKFQFLNEDEFFDMTDSPFMYFSLQGNQSWNMFLRTDDYDQQNQSRINMILGLQDWQSIYSYSVSSDEFDDGYKKINDCLNQNNIYSQNDISEYSKTQLDFVERMDKNFQKFDINRIYYQSCISLISNTKLIFLQLFDRVFQNVFDCRYERGIKFIVVNSTGGCLIQRIMNLFNESLFLNIQINRFSIENGIGCDILLLDQTLGNEFFIQLDLRSKELVISMFYCRKSQEQKQNFETWNLCHLSERLNEDIYLFVLYLYRIQNEFDISNIMDEYLQLQIIQERQNLSIPLSVSMISESLIQKIKWNYEQMIKFNCVVFRQLDFVFRSECDTVYQNIWDDDYNRVVNFDIVSKDGFYYQFSPIQYYERIASSTEQENNTDSSQDMETQEIV